MNLPILGSIMFWSEIENYLFGFWWSFLNFYFYFMFMAQCCCLVDLFVSCMYICAPCLQCQLGSEKGIGSPDKYS